MSAAPMAGIRHEPEAQRFVIELAAGTGLIRYRELSGRVLDLNHTFVPPALRGSGIASQLTEHALRYAREHGYRVIPSCPFVATFIERHPQHRDLLA
ncbi:MAG TPA: GNAT family N-acetyltransferase [Gammaproteobacteria bacterium]|nr:GNAT family N-acetyltransferase [Gammaproteobacteria bacterium]